MLTSPLRQSRRNYVDQATALAQNLTYASGDTLILRADDTTVLSASGPGRNSVRLMSNNVYSTHVTVYVSCAPSKLAAYCALSPR